MLEKCSALTGLSHVPVSHRKKRQLHPFHHPPLQLVMCQSSRAICGVGFVVGLAVLATGFVNNYFCILSDFFQAVGGSVNHIQDRSSLDKHQSQLHD
jgi:hypothetical protein